MRGESGDVSRSGFGAKGRVMARRASSGKGWCHVKSLALGRTHDVLAVTDANPSSNIHVFSAIAAIAAIAALCSDAVTVG